MNVKFTVEKKSVKSEEGKNLDAMIVIPAFDESFKILDTILHAVEQQKLKGTKGISHGITVVVNGRPIHAHKKDEKYLSNFQTYLLVQALAHKFPIKKTGDKKFDEAVKRIQNVKVPIFVIDAFSKENARENNNVGVARKLGYDFALTKVKPEGFIVSHDADSRLYKHCLSAVNQLLNMTTSSDIKYDAVSFGLKRHMDDTTLDEKKTVRNHDLFWSIKSAEEVEDTRLMIENKIVWMAGGGSAQSVRSILKTGGHQPIAGEEDTKLGIAIVENGFHVVNAYDDEVPEELEKHIQFATRGRISERASTGYGRSIGKSNEQLQSFPNQEIDSHVFLDRKKLFLLEVQDFIWEEFNKWLVKTNNHGDFDESYLFSQASQKDPDIQNFFTDARPNLMKNFEELLQGSSTGIENTNIIGDNKVSSEDIEKLREAFSSYRPNIVSGQAHHDFYWAVEKVFRKKYPPQTIKEYIDAKFEPYQKIKSSEEKKPVKGELFQGKTFIQTISENPHGKVSSIQNLRDEFLNQVSIILGDRVFTDENLHYKLLAIVIRNSRILRDNRISNFALFLKLALAEEDLETKSDPDLKLIINNDALAFMYASAKHAFNSALAFAIQDIQYFLEFDLSAKEKEGLVKLSKDIVNGDDQFFNTVLEPLQERIKKNANKILVENVWDDIEVKAF